MRNAKGFSLIELLVVLVIIGILAAVATPIYLQNTQKARASEAIATMGLIRQAMRDFRVNRNTYFSIAENKTDGNIQNPLPQSVNTENSSPTPATAGLDVDAGVAQYFSNQAFEVDASSNRAFSASGLVGSPQKPVDFLITAKGKNSVDCASVEETPAQNCAIRAGEVQDYEIEMDNSGRIMVCYKDCDKTENWSVY